jgi:hypothetical protein
MQRPNTPLIRQERPAKLAKSTHISFECADWPKENEPVDVPLWQLERCAAPEADTNETF